MNLRIVNDQRHLTAYALLIAVTAVLISGLSALTVGRRLTRYLMWYPIAAEDRPNGEFHLVPRRGDFADRVKLYVEEYLLGPQTVAAEPALPEAFGVDRVILGGDRTLYVDLAPEPFQTVIVSIDRFDTFRTLLERGILHNFRRVRRVNYTIGGQVPKEITFRIGER